MLNQLQIFEGNFANYIKFSIGKENNGGLNKNDFGYYKTAFKVLCKISHFSFHSIEDILTFNYSLGPQFIDQFREDLKNIHLSIHSWANIHGIAFYNDDAFLNWVRSFNSEMINNKKLQIPAPIFGIDNHDILTPDQNGNFNFDDPRSIFTKSFRLMDNHVNSIRKNTFQDKVDVITFIGHSLSQADYSYFESIFDQYDIFHSNVKLEFYYYQGNLNKGNTEKEKKAITKREERNTMKNIVKLLTSYGSTLKNEHGENIVNKLMLEQRLSVLPNPEVK